MAGQASSRRDREQRRADELAAGGDGERRARPRGSAWSRSARRRSRAVADEAGEDRQRRAARRASRPCPGDDPDDPAKPIARPATRAGVIRSPSQSQAMTAANSGDAELKIAEHAGADRDRRVGEAEERQGGVGHADARRSAASAGAAGRDRRAPRAAARAAASRRATRSAAIATGPNCRHGDAHEEEGRRPRCAARTISSATSRGLNASPSAPARARVGRVRGLEPEQRGLALQAAGVAGEGAVAAEHAVAGHDHRDRVAADGGADRAPGGRRAELAARCRRSCRCGRRAIASSSLPHAALERRADAGRAAGRSASPRRRSRRRAASRRAAAAGRRRGPGAAIGAGWCFCASNQAPARPSFGAGEQQRAERRGDSASAPCSARESCRWRSSSGVSRRE